MLRKPPGPSVTSPYRSPAPFAPWHSYEGHAFSAGCGRAVRHANSLPSRRRPFEQRHEGRLNVSPFFNGFEAQLLSQLATDFQGEEKPDVSRDRRGLCSAGYRQPCRNFACKDARRPALRRSGKGEFWLRATGSGSSPSASLHGCQMKTPSRGQTAASLPSFQVISPPLCVSTRPRPGPG